jgi:hypothetical protein
MLLVTAPSAAVHLAAKALPARDREQEFKSGAVGELRDLDDFAPDRGPALRHFRQRQSAVRIHREDAELEPVRSVHRMDASACHGSPCLEVAQ